MSVVLWYNPRCGTARKVRDYLDEHGIDFDIREYMEDVPSRAELSEVLQKSGMSARALLRDKEPLAKELGLLNGNVSDDDILNAMHVNPILIDRPVVIDGARAILCRPSEAIFDFLPARD